ncbi:MULTISPECIES: hypothetical protein [unclassified Streptomyces]|uniref:hypothetical protein n=1 Tax=unclassified Streptomyces TaxID=2593676 RepID=UPI00095C69E1|nr:hypothetical protein [Streptomyces sp. CB02058]OKI85889.1 hypothetical protein AMK10_35405 [Streptomyces sp. CB02058]
MAAKIGICEDSPRNRRLYEHRRNGWTTIETMRFAVGSDARKVEDIIVRSWRSRLLAPVLDNGYGYNGYTETVSLQELRISEIWSEVCAATDQVMAGAK